MEDFNNTEDCLCFNYAVGFLAFDIIIFARVAELADALDLGSSGETCESSSLSSRIFVNNRGKYAKYS
jgi:hypothetical protein